MENAGGTIIERLKRQKAKIERDIKEANDKKQRVCKSYNRTRKSYKRSGTLTKKTCYRNTTEARFNRTKPLEEIEEQKEILKRKNQGRRAHYE